MLRRKGEKVITQKATVDLTKVEGIGQKRAEQLKAAGINSVEELAKSKPKEISERVGVSENIAFRWIENADDFLSRNK